LEITEDASKVNVEKWVSAHVVPSAPIAFSSDQTYPTLHEGTSVAFTRVAEEGEVWQQFVLNDAIRIIGKEQASNGEIYLIDRVLLE